MARFHRSRRLGFGLAAVIVLLLVAACAGSGAAPNLSSTGKAVPPDEGYAVGDAAPAAPAAAASAQPSDAGRSSAGQNEAAPEQQIVKTGSLDLQVDDVDAAMVKARTAIFGFGGQVSGSQQTSKGDQPVASVTYRIPASRWDDALDALRELAGKVLSAQTQAVEVTGQVLDLGARIDNLKVTEQALQAIMAKATKISDVLAVQEQLTNVQGQIEQLSTQRAHLEDQAAMGTLTVGFQTPLEVVAEAQRGWSLGEQVDAAVAQLVQVGQALATFGVWLGIVGLPLIVLGLCILGLAFLVARRFAPGRPLGPAA
jgi:hypothetical protein